MSLCARHWASGLGLLRLCLSENDTFFQWMAQKVKTHQFADRISGPVFLQGLNKSPKWMGRPEMLRWGTGIPGMPLFWGAIPMAKHQSQLCSPQKPEMGCSKISSNRIDQNNKNPNLLKRGDPTTTWSKILWSKINPQSFDPKTFFVFQNPKWKKNKAP